MSFAKIKLSEEAVEVLNRRYLKNGETPEQMLWRVATHVASVEEITNYENIANEFYKEFSSLRFLPNTPALINAGKPLGQLNACFVIPIGDSIEQIFDAVKYTALIHKSGGGTGFSFSNLRPKNSEVKETLGVSSGPLSFMKIFDSTTEEMKQGGVRRGANMGIMRIDHPDIIDFLTCKKTEGVFSNFNISVGITDDFMDALKQNKEFNLVWEEKVVNTVRAKDLWKLIIEGAWENGEPGIIFIDRINNLNLLNEIETIESTNPCLSPDTTVLTPFGIRTISQISIGDTIWSEDGWVEVLNKLNSGIKDVYEYKTNSGVFLGTDTHKIVEDGIKTKICDAFGIDVLSGIKLPNKKFIHSPQFVIDGLIIGDGSVHRSHTNKYKNIVLYIGDNDFDYFKSKSLASKIHYKYDEKCYKVSTTIIPEELPRTFLRYIPDRFKFETSQNVCSLLRGLYSANGYVIETGNRIGLTVSSYQMSKDIQTLLSSVGIKSFQTINKETLVKHKNGVYKSKQSYIINIITDRHVFRNQIGFIQKYKMEKLQKICNIPAGNPRKRTFDITTKTFYKKEQVFDITVSGNHHTFWSGGLNVSNCAEQPLPPFGSCTLGSINISKFINISKGLIDWVKLRKTINIATRYLDNTISATTFPISQIKKEALKTRRIGLGIMGWADALIKLKIPYGSKKSLKLAEEVALFFSNTSHSYSEQLGIERGIPESLKKIGILRRNGLTTTIAPTGSLSIIAGCSSGIEPVFDFSFEKVCVDTTITLKHPLYAQWEEEHKSNPLAKHPEYFVTAKELSAKQHIDMQAAFQTYIDSGISKTVNAPNSILIDKVHSLFIYAYESGLKSISFYRDGSRDLQALTTTPKQIEQVKTQPNTSSELLINHKMEIRPQLLIGKTLKIKTGRGKLYITINEYNGYPMEVFLKIGKSGKEDFAYSEALGRLISVALRNGVPIEKIINHMRCIGGDNIVFDYEQSIKSVPDAVAIVLEFLYKKENQPSIPIKECSGELKPVHRLQCPDCEQYSVEQEGKCATCKNCGWSKCS